MHNKGRAVLAVLLTVVLCGMLLLSGCSGVFGARVDTEGTDPYQTPNVRGVWNAGSVNDKIEPYFNDVVSSLKQANSNEQNELVGKMRYSVESKDGQKVLCSWIEGTAGQKIMLPDIILNAKKCVVAEEIPECIADYETLKYAMIVASYGVSVDLYNMDSTVTAAQMAEVLVSWYESKTGKTVDISKVNVSVPEEASKKLLALIPEYEYAEELIYDSEATTTMFVDTVAVLMSEIDFETYGVASGSVELMDFVKYAALFLEMYAPEGINNSFAGESVEGEVTDDTTVLAPEDTEEKLSTDWDRLVSEINVYNSVDSVLIQSQDTITRLDLAKNMLLVLKAGYDTDIQPQIALSDCTEESAKAMVDYGIMSNFPEDSNLFSPNYKLHINEIPVITANFTKHCYNEWNKKGSYHYYDYLTMNEICTAFASIESFCAAQNYYTPDEVSENIVNGEGYDWFVSSVETGEYAEKNVTVAAAAMALQWRGKTDNTVVSLREEYLSETDAEWSDERIVSVLEDKGVTAAECEDVSTDAILSELRNGNIVIARYSDTGTDKVQVMVIYGFKKIGNSVKYYVNDPNKEYEKPAYENGMTPGKGEIIESELALWLMNEADGDYIVVYAEGNGPAAEETVSQTDDE